MVFAGSKKKVEGDRRPRKHMNAPEQAEGPVPIPSSGSRSTIPKPVWAPGPPDRPLPSLARRGGTNHRWNLDTAFPPPQLCFWWHGRGNLIGGGDPFAAPSPHIPGDGSGPNCFGADIGLFHETTGAFIGRAGITILTSNLRTNRPGDRRWGGLHAGIDIMPQW